MQNFVKWTGSKRFIAAEIVSYFPEFGGVYFEPFLGSGSVLWATGRTSKVVGSDANQWLIQIWNKVQKDPKYLIDAYKINWDSMQMAEDRKKFYNIIRSRFNKKHDPADFLTLTRMCTNGLIRFNKKGEFNTSYHYQRIGMNPARLASIIMKWHEKIASMQFRHMDYRDILGHVRQNDFVFLDPPYFNTDSMYFGELNALDLWLFLEKLNEIGVKWAMTLNSKRDSKKTGIEVPKSLYKSVEGLTVGPAAYSKYKGESTQVSELLYMNY